MKLKPAEPPKPQVKKYRRITEDEQIKLEEMYTKYNNWTKQRRRKIAKKLQIKP